MLLFSFTVTSKLPHSSSLCGAEKEEEMGREKEGDKRAKGEIKKTKTTTTRVDT